MATLTIRNLDENVKRELRKRAAERGVSMEQEARDRSCAERVEWQHERHRSAPGDCRADVDRRHEGEVWDLRNSTCRERATNARTRRHRMTLSGKRILLIIGGGIAAYKSLDLIRRLRERGASVRSVMTEAAQHFVTPLSVGALTADHVFTELFDRQDEQDVGHIRLSREADLIVVAPATADLMAKLANGLANDLASAVLLATDKPGADGAGHEPENVGASGDAPQPRDAGEGRRPLRRPEPRRDGRERRGRRRPHGRAAGDRRGDRGAARHRPKPLAGRKIIVTSGPTHEPIDPVRYIANRSSGKQGHAIAAALARLGADVRLVSGPVAIPDPAGVTTVHVETRATRCATRSSSCCRPTPRSSSPPSPTGGTDGEAGEKIKKVAGKGPPIAEHGRESGHPRRHRPSCTSGPISSSALPPKPRTCWRTPQPS